MRQKKDLNHNERSPSVEWVVKRHTSLVHRIAHHLLARLPQSIQLDDLIQAGMMGLLEAFQHFNPNKQCTFETFASIRIRGAMLDEVRKFSWLPRSYPRTIRRICKAINLIEHRTKQHASDHDIAFELDVSLDEYYRLLNQTSMGPMLGFDEIGLDEEKIENGLCKSIPGPLEETVQLAFKQNLVRYIQKLPHQEHLVLALYYDKELNLKEISKILEVTESRICQIHNQAMFRLKSRMQDWR